MSLFACLENIVQDPRNPKGVRHPLSAILKATILGLLSGMTCIEHIAQYIVQRWEEVSEALGFTHHHPPDPGTYRLVLSRIDCAELGKALSEWVGEVVKEKQFDVAVDGKASRGTKVDQTGQALEMVNVFVHDLQVTLAQWRIPNKKGEPTVFAEHLKELVEKYPGIRLFTEDAYYSGRNLCEAITQLGKDYLVRIKGNQQDLSEAIQTWFESRLQTTPEPDAKSEEKRGGGRFAGSCS